MITKSVINIGGEYYISETLCQKKINEQHKKFKQALDALNECQYQQCYNTNLWGDT